MTRTEAIKILSCRDNRGVPIAWQDGFVDAVDTAIKTLKATQWVLVSERLPKPYTSVLVCSDIGNIEISHGDVFDSTGKFEWFPSGWRFGNVVAWMPLPSPYKENEP